MKKASFNLSRDSIAIFIFLFWLIATGCHHIIKPIARKTTLPPEVYPNHQTFQEINYWIKEVEKIARQTQDLNTFGREVVQPSAKLLDLGKPVAFVLMNILRDPARDWKVRYFACDLLGYLDNPGCLSQLKDTLQNPEENRFIREAAISSLKELGTPQCQIILKQSLGKVTDRYLRDKISKALREFP